VLSYSITVHLHSIELHSHSKSERVHAALSKLQFLQYLSYWNRSFAAFSQAIKVPIFCSIRVVSATASTVLVLQQSRQATASIRRSIRSNRTSRQQRLQYWTYRVSLGNSTKRLEVPFNRSFRSRSTCPSKDSTPFKRSQCLSKPGQYPIEPTVLVQARTVPHSSKPF
jgi:hypothetical protein